MRDRAGDAPITSEVFIRLLKSFLIISLLLPINVKAQEPVLAYNEISYQALSADNALQTKLSLPNPDPPKAKVAPTGSRSGNVCYCLAWAKKRAGIGVPSTYAAWHPTNSTTPASWGLVFTNEGYWVWDARLGKRVWTGHAAYYVLDGEWLVLEEANYKRCQITVGRRIKVGDPIIRGYYNAF